MTVGGTQAEYVVDIWSGNHPFFLGKSTAIMTNAGRVSKFGDRFGDLGALSEVETIDDVKAGRGGVSGVLTEMPLSARAIFFCH